MAQIQTMGILVVCGGIGYSLLEDQEMDKFKDWFIQKIKNSKKESQTSDQPIPKNENNLPSTCDTVDNGSTGRTNTNTKATGSIDTPGNTTDTPGINYLESVNNNMFTLKNSLYVLGGVAVVYSGYQLYHYGWKNLYDNYQYAWSFLLPFPTHNNMKIALAETKECINKHSDNIEKALENKIEKTEEDIVYQITKDVEQRHRTTQERNEQQHNDSRRMNTQEHANTRESCNINIVNARQKIENIQQNISQENTNNKEEIINVIYTLGDKNVADQDTKEQRPSLHHQCSDTNFHDPSQILKTSSGVTTAGATPPPPPPYEEQKQSQTMEDESLTKLARIHHDLGYVDNILLRRQNRLNAKEQEGVERNSGTKCYDY